MKKLFSFENIIALASVCFILYIIYPEKDSSKKMLDYVFGTRLYKEKPETPEVMAARKKYYDCIESIENKYYPPAEQENKLKKILNPTIDNVMSERRLKEKYCIELIETCDNVKENSLFVILFEKCLK